MSFSRFCTGLLSVLYLLFFVLSAAAGLSGGAVGPLFFIIAAAAAAFLLAVAARFKRILSRLPEWLLVLIPAMITVLARIIWLMHVKTVPVSDFNRFF